MSVVEDAARGSVRYLPHAVVATAAVTLAPAAVVWGVALSGVATGFIPLLAVGLVASLLVAYGGRVVWQMLPGSRDLLFSDLMLWGWLRRWYLERRLRQAGALLGLDPRDALERGDELDPETRTKALTKLAIALEARDPRTHGHSRRVARYSTMIARKLGVPSAQVATIRLGATLHDVGKLVVPPALLSKPGRPTEVERAVITRHAPVGADMVSPIGDDQLTQIVAHHHERLDGSGYPSQLSGDQIPLGARIVAVADAFDTLTSPRIYKPAKRHRDVFRILGEEMRTQLDPVAVQAFQRCYSGFTGIAAWSIVTGAPLRLLLPLASQAPVAGGSLSAKALAALAAAAVAGSAVPGSSPTEPRDTGAGRSAVPALASVSAAAESVGQPSPAGRNAGQDGGASNAGPGASSGEHAPGGDRPGQGGGPGPGDEPPPDDEPNPGPDPGDPPGPDRPPIPDNPGRGVGQIVGRQLGRLGEPIGHLLNSVPPPEPPGRVGAQHGDSPGVLGGGAGIRRPGPPRGTVPRPPRGP